MAIDIDPKSEKELQEANLAPAAEYDFDVLSAEDLYSKAGNPMIKVKIGLYVGDKVRNHVYDYLLAAMEAKLRHFCDTTGLLSRYESGQLEAADCVGRSGRAKIVIEPAKGSYAAKNVVRDYVCRSAKPLSQNQQGPDPVDEGDIPF